MHDGAVAGEDADGRRRRAIAAIDAANADDPDVIVIDGVEQPKELAHAELMVQWVRSLDPAADDAQLIAARAHHLRRWELPRTSYPDGRAGYLRWRSEQRQRHGEQVAAILVDVGYDDAFVERVRQIVRKVGISDDAAVQTHEDALCLVFLQTQLDDLADRLGDAHIVEVLRRSVVKMSDQGVAVAATLPLGDRGQALLGQAVALAREPPSAQDGRRRQRRDRATG